MLNKTLIRKMAREWEKTPSRVLLPIWGDVGVFTSKGDYVPTEDCPASLKDGFLYSLEGLAMILTPKKHRRLKSPMTYREWATKVAKIPTVALRAESPQELRELLR